MGEIRQRGLPAQRGADATANQGQRLGDSFLGGLVSGVAALLVARPGRQETDSPELAYIPEYEIGAGSAWGVGG